MQKTLTLQKIYDPQTQNGPILQNRLVTFFIKVTNQGTVDATDVQITDYIPEELSLEDPAWTFIPAGNQAVYNMLLDIDAGQEFAIPITFRVNPFVTGQVINRAEISAANDEFGTPAEDFDSNTDNNPGDDPGGVVNTSDDDNIDGNGKQGEDEDDADPEDIFVETFDLASLGPSQQHNEFLHHPVILYKWYILRFS